MQFYKHFLFFSDSSGYHILVFAQPVYAGGSAPRSLGLPAAVWGGALALTLGKPQARPGPPWGLGPLSGPHREQNGQGKEGFWFWRLCPAHLGFIPKTGLRLPPRPVTEEKGHIRASLAPRLRGLPVAPHFGVSRVVTSKQPPREDGVCVQQRAPEVTEGHKDPANPGDSLPKSEFPASLCRSP